MQHLIHLSPAVHRLIKTSTLGVLSTAVAASATLWLITGTLNPSAWVAAYEHAQRCAVADAALSPACTASVAQSAVSVAEPSKPSPDGATPPADASSGPPAADSTAPNPVAAAPAQIDSEPEDDSAEPEDS